MQLIEFTDTYTYTDDPSLAPGRPPMVIKAKMRQRVMLSGETFVTVRGLAALLSEQLNEISDRFDKFNAIEALSAVHIGIYEQPRSDDAPDLGFGITLADGGFVETSYRGTAVFPVSVVTELGVRLRRQLTELNPKNTA